MSGALGAYQATLALSILASLLAAAIVWNNREERGGARIEVRTGRPLERTPPVE